jgi:hypothetical protein
MAVKPLLVAVFGAVTACLGLLATQDTSLLGQQELKQANSGPVLVSHEPLTWSAHPAAFSSVDLWQVLAGHDR